MLTVGDIWREGDQYRTPYEDTWKNLTNFGYRISSSDLGAGYEYRRPIKNKSHPHTNIFK